MKENTYKVMIKNFIKNLMSTNEIYIALFGCPCPEFLYCDDTQEYISAFSKEKVDYNSTEVTVTVCDKVVGAKNFGKLNWFQKRSLLRDVNRFWNGDKVFRWKRILTITSLQ